MRKVVRLNTITGWWEVWDRQLKLVRFSHPRRCLCLYWAAQLELF